MDAKKLQQMYIKRRDQELEQAYHNTYNRGFSMKSEVSEKRKKVAMNI